MASKKWNNDNSKEKNGSLSFLTPNRQIELAKIEFFNMGIFRIQPDKTQSATDQIRPVTVELYVEAMKFNYMNKVIP
jgi:hypothetical protein